MIELERTDQRLIVSRGPTSFYTALTCFWLAVVCGAGVLAFNGQLDGGGEVPSGVLLSAPTLVLLGLLWGWRKTEYRFDPRAGRLTVAGKGLVGTAPPIEVAFSSVTAVVDRCSSDGRVIELILTNESVLVLARARGARSLELDDVARRVGTLLQQPIGETFYPGGARRICDDWGYVEGFDDWLAHLVDAELVEPLRTSQSVVEPAYRFRHALVCDAALGLLADADRRVGHLAAGAWLERMGENDAIVLAWHAQQGGDLQRAIYFYTRAAQQSLAQRDFEQAFVRVRRGIDCGATGEALGVLLSIEAASYYSQGRWTEASRAGLSALELVARGGAVWCATVETLMQVLPNLGEFERNEALAKELLRIVPAPEARTAYVRALSAQVLGYAISGARERCQACLDFIDERGVVSEKDVTARGYVRLWRSIFTFVLGADMFVALTLVEQAIADLTESQIMYRVSLAHTVHAFILWGLGDLTGSERAARSAQSIAEEIKDDYHAAIAAWYLGLTLTEAAEPAKLDEAERCAQAMTQLQSTPLFEATSQNVTARAALLKQDWLRAVDDGHKARAGLAALPPYRFIASASLVHALLDQGCSREAASIAREDLELLARVQSPVFSEVTLRVAAAQALFEEQDRTGAERVLREALQQIELRAAKLPDPVMRERYLSGRSENRRAFELERAWFGVQ